jgi:hypothetical protein
MLADARTMGNERPANFSFEDGLQVAGVCDRAEYLERLTLYHAGGKLPVSGWPIGTSERRGIPPTDYRLAFGTDGRGAMAVRKDLAAKWLPGKVDEPTSSKTRPSRWLGPRYSEWLGPGNPPSSEWRAPPRSAPSPQPGRPLLAENDTEIDERAYRAIMRACRSKPGDAPLAFTNLQLGGKEFIKLFRIRKAPGAAPAGARALTEATVRQILQAKIDERGPGRAFSQREAVALVYGIDPKFSREVVRSIMRELTGSRRAGRPRKIGGK